MSGRRKQNWRRSFTMEEDTPTYSNTAGTVEVCIALKYTVSYLPDPRKSVSFVFLAISTSNTNILHECIVRISLEDGIDTYENEMKIEFSIAKSLLILARTNSIIFDVLDFLVMTCLKCCS